MSVKLWRRETAFVAALLALALAALGAACGGDDAAPASETPQGLSVEMHYDPT